MFDYKKKWKINSQSTLPYMKQLENNIRWSISAGDIAREEKLPTIRALASELDISANTVRSVYKKLENEGYVVTRPHYGTTVLSTTENVEDCTNEFTLAIKNVLRSALTDEEVRDIFERVYAEYTTMAERKPILLVESNQKIIDRLSSQIEKETATTVEGVLLVDFDEYIKKNHKNMERFGAIVTTYFHYSMIRKTKGVYAPMVCGMVQNVKKSVLTALAELPHNGRVGIVCNKNDSALALRNLALSVREDLNIEVCFDDCIQDVKDFSNKVLIICASPATVDFVQDIVGDRVPVYEFLGQINAQSMNMLREFLK